jgi:hypothetical protein
MSFSFNKLTTHNPKVAGSNPAPATNQINNLRFDGRSDNLQQEKPRFPAPACTGLSTISTILLLVSRFEDAIACP